LVRRLECRIARSFGLIALGVWELSDALIGPMAYEIEREWRIDFESEVDVFTQMMSCRRSITGHAINIYTD